MKGLELKELREKFKISQDELSKLANVDRRTIINWEKREDIPHSKVAFIHSIFNSIKSENYDSENFEEQNLALEPESSYPGNIHKLAYESIIFFDELMQVKQYKDFIENKIDLKLKTFKDLKELEKYINR